MDALGRRYVNVYGRDPGPAFARPTLGQRRRSVRPPGAARRSPHARRVPRSERDDQQLESARGHGPGGAVRTSAYLSGGHRRLERPEHPTPSVRDGVDAADQRQGPIEAMNGAYESGLVFDGGIDIPIIDWRHYLDAELDMHNARQSFAVAGTDAEARRRSVEPGDLVHRRAAGTRFRPDAGGARRDGSVAREHARASRARSRGQQACRCRRQLLRNRRNADRSRPRVSGTGSSTPRYAGRVRAGLRDPRPRRAPWRGAPFDEELYKCKLQPVEAALARGLYGSWVPSEN